MSTKWGTKDKDLQIAQNIIDEYADKFDAYEVGLFELEINKKNRKMDLRIASWVVRLTDVFYEKYGVTHGDEIVRRIIGCYLTHDKTIH